MAARGRSAEPVRVADAQRAAQSDRPAAPRGGARPSRPRVRLRPHRARGSERGRGDHARRPSRTHLLVRASGARTGRTRCADAALRRRFGDRRDRARVSRRRSDDGAADRAREAPRQGNGDPVPHPCSARTRRSSGDRARGDLSRLQRRLRGDVGRSPGARRVVRRSDPPRASGRRTDARATPRRRGSSR